jgi:excisionase family DNA binding protein
MDFRDKTDGLLTPAEAAALARASRKAIYRWANTGQLGSVRLGRLLRIRADDLREFIERGHKPARPPTD